MLPCWNGRISPRSNNEKKRRAIGFLLAMMPLLIYAVFGLHTASEAGCAEAAAQGIDPLVHECIHTQKEEEGTAVGDIDVWLRYGISNHLT